MCGIAGALCIGERGVSDAVEAQLRLLDHRGPDSWGLFPRDRAVIGQTRLAVIDLVTGDPPITNADGSIGAVLNGEIYNYRAIRDGLRGGHRFATTGDTEVIAHLAEDHEPVALARRLEGMFAFAVWDESRRRLVLGRDRLGKKPLYYWSDGRRLVFASEIKAVVAHPWVPRELDQTALPGYLTFGYVPTPRTFFSGVRSVPPGHVLTFEDSTGLKLQPYWRPRIPGPGDVTTLDVSGPEAAGLVRQELAAAVERRMVSDVPLGAFLSGGVDSSAVVGLMAAASPTPVRTFTIGFDDDEGFDERPFARLVAERFGTDHTEFVVKPDAVELIERLVWHYDQPFGDSSAVPTFLLSELTRGHVTVALCGDGGDELFAGYERLAAAVALNSYQRVPQPVRRRVADLAARVMPGGISRGPAASLRRFLARSHLGPLDAYQAWVSVVGEDQRTALLGSASHWALDDYRRIWVSTEGGDVLGRLLELNLRTYLLDDLLPKVDRMSMAHGLEVRAPYLDRQLLELALRLPPRLQLRAMSGKRVLKAAVADLLPGAVLGRRKQGFGVPLDRWFRNELKPFVDSRLGGGESRVRCQVDPGALDGLLDEHQAGKANHGLALWSLLTLEVFLRREGW